MADGTRTKRPRRKPVDPATAAKARQIEEEVRDWYRWGKKALGLSGKDAKDVGQAMQALGVEVGTNPATLRRARQFARVYKSEKHLEALLTLRTPEGLPLGWSHVQELISVEHRAARARLQRLAATEGWTVRRLKAEVQQIHGGKRSEGGRKFAPPGTPEEALRRLSDQGRMWIKLSKQTILLDSYNVIDRISELEPGSRPEHLVRLKELLAVLAEVEEVARMAKTQLGKLERRLGAADGASGSLATGGGSKEIVRRDER
ncbi:MAG: hypothetical protein WKF75_09020 [Singulisphaera sp.]